MQVKLCTEDPVVGLMASMELIPSGFDVMAKWLQERRPNCLPDGYTGMMDLFPHGGFEVTGYEEGRDSEGAPIVSPVKRKLSGNELLVEATGRKCYDSFGGAAGQKENRGYIANTQKGNNPHASILYHAKFSLFIAGISRRVSHELIRNYVGADRDQEGNPSQESTRFTHHYGSYIVHPKDLNDPVEIEIFRQECEANYAQYKAYVNRKASQYQAEHGTPPKGLDRKRIYESAAGRLGMQAETSFIWTTNPSAFAKMCRERGDEHADLEFQRLVRVLKRVVVPVFPNLFPNMTAE